MNPVEALSMTLDCFLITSPPRSAIDGVAIVPFSQAHHCPATSPPPQFYLCRRPTIASLSSRRPPPSITLFHTIGLLPSVTLFTNIDPLPAVDLCYVRGQPLIQQKSQMVQVLHESWTTALKLQHFHTFKIWPICMFLALELPPSEIVSCPTVYLLW